MYLKKYWSWLVHVGWDVFDSLSHIDGAVPAEAVDNSAVVVELPLVKLQMCQIAMIPWCTVCLHNFTLHHTNHLLQVK